VNDVPVKIKGVANHQDFAGVGVAVPDKLQVYVPLALNRSPPLLRAKYQTAHHDAR
jgi:hypothetical protein